MELLKDNVWIKRGNTNVGIFKTNKVTYVIDTGSSVKFAKELLSEIGDKQKVVLNTHSHADHIQGNVLFEKNGAKIYANELEVPFIRNPALESLCLYGANPPKVLHLSFYLAKPSDAMPFESEAIPSECEIVSLPGHSPGMTGIKINRVIFCGDAYFGKNILEKYSYPYLVNVKKFLASLEILQDLDVDLYVPSHGNPTPDPHSDIEETKIAVQKFVNVVFKTLKEPLYVEILCEKVSKKMSITLNNGTFYLFRSFISSILSYLEESKEIVEIKPGMWTSSKI